MAGANQLRYIPGRGRGRGRTGILAAPDGGLEPAVLPIKTAAAGGSISGSMAVTDSADTALFSGDHGQQGALSVTDTADSFSSVGDVCHVGTLAATDQPDSAAFAGDVAHVGAFAATDSADIAAFSGLVVTTHTGILEATDGGDIASLLGTVEHVGLLAANDGQDQSQITGDVDHAGAFTASELADAFSASGSVVGATLSVAHVAQRRTRKVLVKIRGARFLVPEDQLHHWLQQQEEEIVTQAKKPVKVVRKGKKKTLRIDASVPEIVAQTDDKWIQQIIAEVNERIQRRIEETNRIIREGNEIALLLLIA